TGAIITGGQANLVADHDLTLETPTHALTFGQQTITLANAPSIIQVDQLTAHAGHDVNLIGAIVNTTGDLNVTADHDLNLGTTQQTDRLAVVFNDGHYRAENITNIGSLVTA